MNGFNTFEGYGVPGRSGAQGVLNAADKIAANGQAIQAIRNLHRIITGTHGIQFCEHCCLNKIGERRFSCHGNHTHHDGDHPCPTLAILAERGL